MFFILSTITLILSLGLMIFSYLWVDNGLFHVIKNSHQTFNLYEGVFNFAYENRELLAQIYVGIIVLFFLLQVFLLFSKNLEKISAKKLFILAGVTTTIFALSYPFISHDFFAYIFYARMLVFHHLNPYIVSPQHLINIDYWITFIHNIEIVYPYGPLFLLYTAIPQFILSSNRLVLNLLVLKLMSGVIFFFAGILLYKLLGRDRKVFSLWYFNPLFIIESLINGHNDIIMLATFFLSLLFLSYKKFLAAWVTLIISVLVKFVTIGALPIFVVSEKWRPLVFRVLGLGIYGYILTTSIAVHAWYYTWPYLFIPFMKLRKVSLLSIYIIGTLLLINYYPFVKSRLYGEALPIPNLDLWVMIILISIVCIELNLYGKLKNIKYLKL